MPGPSAATGGQALNLFYAEPNSDRWLPYDRYPRRLIRRIFRGPPRLGGQRIVFLNLCAGLKKLGVPFRLNDFDYARSNPQSLVCLVGKWILLEREWENPILFGAAGDRHPVDDPALFDRLPVKRMLVPCEWVVEMFKPYWGEEIFAWPVGIDTERWRPAPSLKRTDILLYDKVRWVHERFEQELIDPVRDRLRHLGLTYREIRYGAYWEDQFEEALSHCRAMIFLCEHETQGLAYQQALSCGVPVLAWDRGGLWRDTKYYPERVVFEPVTSVPYFDERCGRRFSGADEFEAQFGEFWDGVREGAYAPRDYILENLTLEICARAYLDHVEAVR